MTGLLSGLILGKSAQAGDPAGGFSLVPLSVAPEAAIHALPREFD